MNFFPRSWIDLLIEKVIGKKCGGDKKKDREEARPEMLAEHGLDGVEKFFKNVHERDLPVK